MSYAQQLSLSRFALPEPSYTFYVPPTPPWLGPPGPSLNTLVTFLAMVLFVGAHYFVP